VGSSIKTMLAEALCTTEAAGSSTNEKVGSAA
jgi:hypothetical protein